MLERVNQLIQLRQDFLHLGARGRIRERQTQSHELQELPAKPGYLMGNPENSQKTAPAASAQPGDGGIPAGQLPKSAAYPRLDYRYAWQIFSEKITNALPES